MKSVCTKPFALLPAMGVLKCICAPAFLMYPPSNPGSFFFLLAGRLTISVAGIFCCWHQRVNTCITASLLTTVASMPRSKSPRLVVPARGRPVLPSSLPRRFNPVTFSSQVTVAGTSATFMRCVSGRPCSSLNTLPPVPVASSPPSSIIIL